MRVKLEKSVVDDFFELIVKSAYFVNWTDLSKRVSCSRWTIKDIRQNKRTFPKEVFEKLLRFIDSNKHNYFLSNVEYLDDFWAIKNKWDKKLERLRYKLEKKNGIYYLKLRARLCGYLAGDGAIASRPNTSANSIRYDIKFAPDDLNMAESFNSAFYKLYGKKFNIIKCKTCNNYQLNGSNKVAYFDLTKIAKFGVHDWRVPFDFLKTKSMKAEWLRAFFDSEAHVGKNKIQLQSVNKAGIYGIKFLLESLGIEVSKIYEYRRKQKNWSINYLLEIRKKASLKKYLKLIGFNHSYKKHKLELQAAGMAESGRKRRARDAVVPQGAREFKSPSPRVYKRYCRA